MDIRILSFDLTGTLATFRYCDSVWFEGLPRLYAQKNALSVDEARTVLRKAYDEIGEEALEWYDIKYWFNRFGLGTGWAELLQQHSHTIEFYDETQGVLERCSQSYDLVLITNAAREFVEVETPSITKYFRKVISSVSDFGEVKKHPEFYARVCDSLGVDPSAWVHVGDHWQFDFMAPRGIGMTSFFLDRKKERSGEFIIHSLGELERKLV